MNIVLTFSELAVVGCWLALPLPDLCLSQLYAGESWLKLAIRSMSAKADAAWLLPSEFSLGTILKITHRHFADAHASHAHLVPFSPNSPCTYIVMYLDS